MHIGIVGATGYIGQNLTHHFIHKTNHTITAVAPTATKLRSKYNGNDRFIAFNADVFDESTMTNALESCDVVYYLIHMMARSKTDFYNQESLAAHRFSASAKAAGVKRVVFLGGLGNDTEKLSEHLESRHNTGTILREQLPLVIELRASMIIGHGSVSFDIIDNLVKKLPVMTLPRWSISKTQPIALSDTLDYLVASATIRTPHHQIIEIGGSDVVTYKELYKLYARWVGKNPLLVRVPFLPESIAGRWLDIFTPQKHAKVGKIMVHSLSNSMVVTNDTARNLFPNIRPRSLVDSFKQADTSVWE